MGIWKSLSNVVVEGANAASSSMKAVGNLAEAGSQYSASVLADAKLAKAEADAKRLKAESKAAEKLTVLKAQRKAAKKAAKAAKTAD